MNSVSVSDKYTRFLLVRLHMNKIVQQHSPKEVLLALENLPDGIDDIYDEAMERIEQQCEADKRLAKRVLSWITHACRPLSVEELQHALAISPNMTELDPDTLIYKRKLTSVCAGLVIIDEGQNIFRLARKSVPFATCTRSDGFSPQIIPHNSISKVGESPTCPKPKQTSLKRA
jgi:hypothetical protein